MRRTVTLAPHETARVDFVLGVAENREAALALVEKYHNPRMADRALDLAWTHSQVTLRHLNASEAEAQLYARLASALIYANPARRATPGVLLGNRRGQSGLWSYGISGDAPIVLLRISDAAKIEIVQQLIQAHSYWRMKGLAVELVILNEDTSVYRQPLHDQIISLIASGIEAQMMDKPGGIFVRRLEQVSSEDRVLCNRWALAASCVRAGDEHGTLAEQLERPGSPEPLIPALTPTRSPFRDSHEFAPLPPRELIFHNGLGGFTPDGREYVITLAAGPDDAGSLGECAGQSVFRNRRLGERRRLHLGREQPRVSPDALEQRPGHGRHRARPSTSGMSRPDNSGRRRRCPRAARRRMSSATGLAIPCSSTPRTASPPS